MGKFKPSAYDISRALKEVSTYNGGIFVGDTYVTKDHGDYIEINIDAQNVKGHISYDLYFDDNGNLVDWRSHKTN